MVVARAIRRKKPMAVRVKKRGTGQRSSGARHAAGGALQASQKATASAGRKHPGHGQVKGKRRTSGGGASALWVALKSDDGCAAVLTVGEQIGALRDDVSASCQFSSKLRGARRSEAAWGGRKGRVGGLTAPRVCRAFAALGHAQRARMLGKLLEGPATYRSLQRLTKLKAGPLYHHIHQMRMAGLIRPKQRDLYELTRGGRNLILAASVTVPLIADARRRPQPVG